MRDIHFPFQESCLHIYVYLAGRIAKDCCCSYGWVSAWMASGRGVCQWALETAVEQTGGCTCRGCSPSRQLCRSSPPCGSSQKNILILQTACSDLAAEASPSMLWPPLVKCGYGYRCSRLLERLGLEFLVNATHRKYLQMHLITVQENTECI